MTIYKYHICSLILFDVIEHLIENMTCLFDKQFRTLKVSPLNILSFSQTERLDKGRHESTHGGKGYFFSPDAKVFSVLE